jgi:hypothetical protein
MMMPEPTQLGRPGPLSCHEWDSESGLPANPRGGSTRNRADSLAAGPPGRRSDNRDSESQHAAAAMSESVWRRQSEALRLPVSRRGSHSVPVVTQVTRTEPGSLAGWPGTAGPAGPGASVCGPARRRGARRLDSAVAAQIRPQPIWRRGMPVSEAVAAAGQTVARPGSTLQNDLIMR